MITTIGEGRWTGSNCISHDRYQTNSISNIQEFTDKNNQIDFLFPNLFNTPNFIKELYYQEQILKLTNGTIPFKT